MSGWSYSGLWPTTAVGFRCCRLPTSAVRSLVSISSIMTANPIDQFWSGAVISVTTSKPWPMTLEWQPSPLLECFGQRWAAVPGQYVEGVENYLIEQLDPMISQHPLQSDICIPVNLPAESTSPAAASLPCRPSLKRSKLRGFASVLRTFVESCGFTFRKLVRQTFKSDSPPRHHQARRRSNRPSSMSLWDRGRDTRFARLEWTDNAAGHEDTARLAERVVRSSTRF
jgi:hypothetical protein